MTMTRRKVSQILIFFLLVLPWIFRFLVSTPANPPRRAGADLIEMLSPPREVATLLRGSCYDCHSYQTRWRWYSRVIPASWLVEHDVADGRDHLNFSTWNEYTSAAARGKLKDALAEMQRGEMPLKIYLLAHPGKRPTPEQIQAFRVWLGKLDAASP